MALSSINMNGVGFVCMDVISAQADRVMVLEMHLALFLHL